MSSISMGRRVQRLCFGWIFCKKISAALYGRMLITLPCLIWLAVCVLYRVLGTRFSLHSARKTQRTLDASVRWLGCPDGGETPQGP